MGAGCSFCKGGIAKIVNQYDLDGNYITTFNSCSDAGSSVGLSAGAISKACRIKCPSAGYQWRYVSTNSKEKIEAYIPKLFNNRAVEQYSLEGKFIRRFDSITIAETETGASKICMVCKGQRKSSGGFIWKYAHNETTDDV